MRADQVLQHPMTPLSTPIFPFRPTRFTDREYLNIVYRTDTAVLRALVPEPLEIAVTHVLLDEGHLWGKKRVAIPIGAVTGVNDGVRLGLAKDEVRDLPSVDLDDPE
jgi:hypothetical protein